MADEQDTVDENEGSGLAQANLLPSYLAFAGRALQKRRLLALLLFVTVVGVTLVAVSIWPRTYHCEMRLMTQRNDVLASRTERGEALRGASEVIVRHDNVEAIVKQTDLAHKWDTQRAPFLKLKDSLMALVRGTPSDADKEAMMVATLESRLSVGATDGTLTIGVDWPDPQMAARLVETAEQNFLESRHVAEVSSVAEYISILEGHAATLRDEIESLAEQIQRVTEERLEQANRSASANRDEGRATPAPAPRRTAPRPKLQADEDLPRLKVMLETKQNAIRQFEEDRKRRVSDLQARLTELKSRYTPVHPAVVDLEQQIATMSKESPQISTLKAEAQQLEADIKQRSNAYLEGGQRPEATGGGAAAGAATGAAAGATPQGAGPLPTDIMQLMQASVDGADPAIGAQFRYAVAKYTTVRNQISTARIDLDTAQAAFKYRYKVVSPAAVPMRPVKPKVPVMIGGGFFFALMLALLVPLGLELRTGKIVERWQVAQMRLPILAELKFPPGMPPD